MTMKRLLLAALATCMGACAGPGGGPRICRRDLSTPEAEAVERFLQATRLPREEVESILGIALSQPKLRSPRIHGVYDLDSPGTFPSPDLLKDEMDAEKAWEERDKPPYRIIVMTGHAQPTRTYGDIFYLAKTAGAWKLVGRSAWTGNEPDTPPESPRYFPEGVFGPNDDWMGYSWSLLGMKEPSLIEKQMDTNATIYRLLYLRSFDPPVAIRIEVREEGKSAVLHFKEDEDGDGEPGGSSKSKRLSLDEKDLRDLNTMIDNIQIWKMKTRKVAEEGVIYLDGARFIVEVLDKGKYHVVDRMSHEDQNFDYLCLFMVILSEQKIGRIY